MKMFSCVSSMVTSKARVNCEANRMAKGDGLKVGDIP